MERTLGIYVEKTMLEADLPLTCYIMDLPDYSRLYTLSFQNKCFVTCDFYIVMNINTLPCILKALTHQKPPPYPTMRFLTDKRQVRNLIQFSRLTAKGTELPYLFDLWSQVTSFITCVKYFFARG